MSPIVALSGIHDESEAASASSTTRGRWCQRREGDIGVGVDVEMNRYPLQECGSDVGVAGIRRPQ